MYYEEAIIDGILHIKTTPNGKWIKLSAKGITLKYMELKKEQHQTAALRTAAREFLQASELNDMVTMNEWIEKYNALAARLDGQE